MQVCDMCGGRASEPFAEKHGLEYLRCAKCAFVFSKTADFDFAAFNEEIIEDMRAVHVRKLVSPRHLKHYRQLLKEFEPYRQTGRFLEIGCSTGCAKQVSPRLSTLRQINQVAVRPHTTPCCTDRASRTSP